ncbi:sulfotransferase [bacterium]|nr:sulfotransferase [bacterium]
MDPSHSLTFGQRCINFGKRQIRDFKRRPKTKYQQSLIDRGWYDLSARSQLPMIFIGGCGRSGTTLLREMLNRHPNIFCGPETSMFGLPFWPNNISKMWNIEEGEIFTQVSQAPNLAVFAEQFYLDQSNKAGKKRSADKTPNNIRVIGKMLTWFPNSRFIHIVRDGRDVACSLRHHPKQKIIDGKIVPSHINRPISECAARWLNDTSSGLAYRSHPRYCEIKYEDLVQSSVPVLKKLCEFIDEDYTDEMLEPSAIGQDSMDIGRLVNNQNSKDKVSTTSMGRWSRDLSSDEKRDFMNVAGELLITMGYVEDHSWAK